MSEEKPRKKQKRHIIPLEIPEALHKAIDDVAKESGESKSTVMRLAIRAGLPEARENLMRIGKAKSSEQQPPNLDLNEPTKSVGSPAKKGRSQKLNPANPGENSI